MSVGKLISYLFAVAIFAGCAEDDLGYTCINEESTFDIEQVSSLEDGMYLFGGHDAIIIDYDDSHLTADASWRVSSVDVLLMIPASRFDHYPDNINLTVEVFDGTDPATSRMWSVQEVVNVSKLEWSEAYLDNPDQATEQTQFKAWWSFDFKTTIPEAGMRKTSFIVGVKWENNSLPTLGYSNYNRPCNRNWTKLNERSEWKLNSVESDQHGLSDICNWPMLRVKVEDKHECW